MMTREQMRKMLIQLIGIILISCILLIAGSYISSDKANARRQSEYSREFYDLIPADDYSEIDTNILDRYRNISHVYAASDEEGNTLGYVIDITIVNDNGTSLHLLEGVTHEGAQITGIKHVHDEENPVRISDEDLALIAAQLNGRQIPVALNSQREEALATEDTIQRINGLTDGTFYAQKQFADRNGYIDYVEIEVSEGVITRVQWDAFNLDPTTPDRREASLTGAYTIQGESWATQSYNLCHALMNLQDPAKLAMKSDGKTEIIDGVTTNISAFVSLAEECIDNSRQGYDKEDYYAGMDYVFLKLFEGTAEELGFMNDNGFVVYSFADYPNLFTVYDQSGNEAGKLNIREYEDYYRYLDANPVEEGEGEAIVTPVPEEEVTVTPTPAPEQPTYSDGSEDGVVIGFGSNTLTYSIDGLPMSEIRTYVDGAPTNQKDSENVISATNISYRFLKEYLNWMA